MSLFIGVYVSLIVLLSGLSIRFGDRISLYLILLLPFILCSIAFWKKEKIRIPKRTTLVWIGFALFDLISTYYSTDKQLSIERFLLFQAYFSVYVYYFNNKLGIVMERVILVLAVVFTSAYFIKEQLFRHFEIFETNNIFNFFFPAMPGNNHLGIWLGMALIILYFRKKIIPVLVLIPIFISTFSRSSFLSVVVTSTIYFFKVRYEALRKGKFILPLVAIFFLVSVLGIVAFVPRSDVTSDRGQYFSEAILGFIDKPLTGYGPGNFTAISRKYAAQLMGVFGSTSHNLLLDILSGSGMPAFIFFTAFLYHVIKNGRKNIYFWIFMYLFICFNLTYIFAMPAIMLILFIFAGLSYRETETLNINIPALVMVVILFVSSIYLAYSEALYYTGNIKKSLQIYPYRKETYEYLVSQISIERKNEIYGYLDMYKKNFAGLFESYSFSAYSYKRIGDNHKSLNDYLYIYEDGTGFNPAIAKEIRSLYLKTGNPTKAYQFSKGFIKIVLDNRERYSQMVNDTYDFCIQTNKIFLDKAACF